MAYTDINFSLVKYHFRLLKRNSTELKKESEQMMNGTAL